MVMEGDGAVSLDARQSSGFHLAEDRGGLHLVLDRVERALEEAWQVARELEQKVEPIMRPDEDKRNEGMVIDGPSLSPVSERVAHINDGVANLRDFLANLRQRVDL